MLTIRFSALPAVVLLLGMAAACTEDDSRASALSDPLDQAASESTAPDPAGAARLVKKWLITVQEEGPKAACPLMTDVFQRTMPSYSCDRPDVSTSPPFMGVDSNLAKVRVRTHAASSAVVEVTVPGSRQNPAVYTARYDSEGDHWLVAGYQRAAP